MLFLLLDLIWTMIVEDYIKSLDNSKKSYQHCNKIHLLLFFSTLTKLKSIFFSSPHYVTTENKAAKWFFSALTWFFLLVDGFTSHLQRRLLLDDGFFFYSSLHWQFCKYSCCRRFSSSLVPINVVSCLWVCLLCCERCLV